MNNEERTCHLCHKKFSNASDLCVECAEKLPYFISFVEEGFVGVTNKLFGRIEVYSNKDAQPYYIDEIRFLAKKSTNKEAALRKFREKWDFQDISAGDLAKIRNTVKRQFSDV